jgi:hypothetical protein
VSLVAGIGWRIGDRVRITRGRYKGQFGVITVARGRFFVGWTVKTDNGRVIFAADWEIERA